MPRRLIYGQAALLGVSAVTFFMLGMMVGNLTAPGNSESQIGPGTETLSADCRISGKVVYDSNGRDRFDVGSVVLLIPKRQKPPQPLAPGLVMPETFVALDNPTIDDIHQSGGAVVRTNSDGKFDVLVDRDKDFYLLLLSKNRKPAGKRLSESQQLVCAKWFAPSEKIVRDNDFLWREVNAAGEEVDVGFLKFD